MPPSSAQYTVSVATDVEASMFFSSRGTREAKVVPTSRRVGTPLGSNSWPFAAPGGRAKGIIEKRKSLLRSIPAGAGLSLQSEDQDAGADHEDAYPVPSRRSLPQEEEREHRDQHEAQLVNRRDLRGVADLQRAEVTDPRGAGGQPGQHQEEPGVRGERERVAPLARGVHEPGQHDDDDRRANEGRQIGIDTFEPELGEDGGERREHGGPERPVEPAGVAHHAPIAASPAGRVARSGGDIAAAVPAAAAQSPSRTTRA